MTDSALQDVSPTAANSASAAMPSDRNMVDRRAERSERGQIGKDTMADECAAKGRATAQECKSRTCSTNLIESRRKSSQINPLAVREVMATLAYSSMIARAHLRRGLPRATNAPSKLGR